MVPSGTSIHADLRLRQMIDPSEGHADVLLVVPPFAAIDVPAIGPSLLAEGCRKRGLSAAVYYANIPFFSIIGRDIYHAISVEIPRDLFPGEMVFRPFLSPSVDIDELARFATEFLKEKHPIQRNLAESVAELLITASRAIPEYLELVKKDILSYSATIVGFSAMFQQTFPSAVLAEALRALDGGPSLIAIGGANCRTPMAQSIMDAFPAFDYVFSGEADEAFPAFCESVIAGHSPPSERLIECGVLADLSEAAVPDYDDYFRQVSVFREQGLLPSDIRISVLFESSRGCWWGEKHQCFFCGLNSGATRYRQKTTERILDELNILVARHGPISLQAVDNIAPHSFFAKDGLFSVLASGWHDFDLFYEVKANLGLKELDLLARARVRNIQPGIESLSSGALRLINKGITASQNLVLLRECASRGIGVAWNLMIGIPGEESSWYHDLIGILPSITHLQAPEELNSARVDRFSPFFERARDFGISNVRVPKANALLFSGLGVEPVSHFFDADIMTELLADPPLLDALIDSVTKWVDLWRGGDSNPPPKLALIRLSDGVGIIEDTRPIASRKFILVDGDLFRCLERTRVPTLHDQLADIDESVIEEALALRLMVLHEGHYISVVTEVAETFLARDLTTR